MAAPLHPWQGKMHVGPQQRQGLRAALDGAVVRPASHDAGIGYQEIDAVHALQGVEERGHCLMIADVD